MQESSAVYKGHWKDFGKQLLRIIFWIIWSVKGKQKLAVE